MLKLDVKFRNAGIPLRDLSGLLRVDLNDESFKRDLETEESIGLRLALQSMFVPTSR